LFVLIDCPLVSIRLESTSQFPPSRSDSNTGIHLIGEVIIGVGHISQGRICQMVVNIPPMGNRNREIMSIYPVLNYFVTQIEDFARFSYKITSNIKEKITHVKRVQYKNILRYISISRGKKNNFCKNNEVNCGICLEKFHKRRYVFLLKCEHFFHEACMRKWLRSSIVCPFCRKDIRSKS